MARRFKGAGAACCWLVLAAVSPAAGAACPLPGQKEMLIAKLYFGQTMPNRTPLTDAEWRSFLANIVTPRFPSGFTVSDATGQWQDPKTRSITRENTKLVEIAAENTASVRNSLTAVAQSYRKQFRQQSVGMVTSIACAKF